MSRSPPWSAYIRNQRLEHAGRTQESPNRPQQVALQAARVSSPIAAIPPAQSRPTTMSGPGVGFEYPPQEVSWTKRDALLFANSIGCTADELHFLYV